MLKITTTSNVFKTPSPTCLGHSGKTTTHMCLADNCSERLLCNMCVSSHARIHAGATHNIREYLDKLSKDSRIKSNDMLISQIKIFIEKQEETLAAISQIQEDKERDVLNIFDQLKCEINDTLDLAYQKYCNSLRVYHQKKVQDVQRKIHILHNMVKVQTFIQNRAIPSNLEKEELKEMIKLFSKFNTKMSSFSVDLEEKFKMLSRMIRDESQLSLNLDRKRCESIRGNILDLIRGQFELSDEAKHASSTEKRNSDSSDENEKQLESEICALVNLKDNQIATAGRDSKIRIWDLKSGECAGELVGHQDIVWDLQSAFDGKYLISGSADATIKVWKVGEKKLKKTLKSHESAVYALEYKEDTKTLISGDQKGSLFLWDMGEGKVAKKLEGHKKAIWTIKKLAGEKIVTGSDDQEIKIWCLRTGGLIKTLTGHQSCVYNMCVFKGGKQIASCDDDGMIFIWDIEKGVATKKLQAHEKGIRSIAVNENETLIASGGYDRTLRLWDLENLELLRENSSNDAIIRCIRFYSDNALLYCDTNVKNYKFSKL